MELWDVLTLFADGSWLTRITGAIDALPLATLALILTMALIATSIVNTLMKRDSGFEFGFTLAVLLTGGAIANVAGINISLPVASELVGAAIITDIGMVAAGLPLMFLYVIFDA